METNYAKLRLINVNEHTEKKGKFTYLSWAWAVDQLLQHDQAATWSFGEPKMFGDTMMVFCTVNAFGKSLTCQLPVINGMNKPISNPNAMDVNTAMMRCLAKTIALYGIGLYIYAGEDIPDAPAECISEDQLRELKALCLAANIKAEDFAKTSKVETLDKLEASRFEGAKKFLESKKVTA